MSDIETKQRAFLFMFTEPRYPSDGRTKELVGPIVFPDHGAFQIPGLCLADTRCYYTSDGIRRTDTENRHGEHFGGRCTTLNPRITTLCLLPKTFESPLRTAERTPDRMYKIVVPVTYTKYC